MSSSNDHMKGYTTLGVIFRAVVFFSQEVIYMKKESQMQHGLKNRHLQMIALGGAIGTGLFYGSASTISLGGPSIIAAYLICGIVIFLIMRMLGEMAVEEPVSGSFSYYANKYWGSFPGFMLGWNYWFSYVIISMTELTASMSITGSRTCPSGSQLLSASSPLPASTWSMSALTAKRSSGCPSSR